MRYSIVLIAFICTMLHASGAGNTSPEPGLIKHEIDIDMPGDRIVFPPLSICCGNNCRLSDSLVINENQSLRGGLHCSDCLAGSVLKIDVYGFDLNETKVKRVAGTEVLLNGTGYSQFFIDAALPAGLYALTICVANSSDLMMVPVIISNGNIDLNAPDRIDAGDLVDLEIDTPFGDNSSKIFGAVMISRDDCYNASLHLSEDMNLTVSVGNSSATLPGIPSTPDMVTGLLYLFPPNSAVGMVESTDRSAHIQMITDRDWDPGKYMLICGVYSPEEGAMGIKLQEVEVV